ncbi:hypothetical protein [uncultured Methanobrevibacter sp.]|uniref:hypothetical protein n=1 Tax=uncultured Methanobrevibacter sp. TaxID=253161 RepID=UPI0025DB1DF4|nr:hypothetical protein [uncultured Methanobrevibacter sp.]
MYTNQQRILYAKQLKRLHELYVVKSNIHLTYKYKNQNKAIANAQSLQDKIINAIIDDAVYGNSDKIRNIDSTIQELMTTTLENERKRIHHKDDRYVDRAVELNAEKYSQILSNRINREAIKLEQKIESEMHSGLHDGLSEHETRKALKDKYGNTAKARIKNIIKDSVHTNESNIGWINALNEGYSYKVWMNGQGKGKVRAWHRAKLIAPVPIDEYFDIYGSYHAQAMYPGDLYAGAENVANCRCWLRYTNRRPEGLGEKKTVFNIPQTSYLNTSNNTSKNTFNEKVKLKPIETIKTTISHTTKKVTSKIKNIGQKLTGKFRKQKVHSKKHDPKKKTQKSNSGFNNLNPKNDPKLNKHAPKNKNEAPRTIEQIREDILNDKSFTKFIDEILHHNNKTKGKLIEYLTIIDKSHKILKRFIKGINGHVKIPKRFKNKKLHMTIHNHMDGAVIPSYGDMNNNLKHDVKYGIITAETRFGVIKYNTELSLSQKKIVLAIHSTFEVMIFDDFERIESKKIKDIERGSEEYDKLFYKFVSRNINKYVDEFNARLKVYNIEITYINIKR